MIGERFGVRFGEIVDPEKKNGKYLRINDTVNYLKSIKIFYNMLK